MKKIILLLYPAFCILPLAHAQQYNWIDISTNIPTSVSNANLTDIAAIGESVWISCSNLKGVFISNDGGNTFTFKDLGVGIQGLYRFADGYTGWCAGGAYGYKTEDGGESWNPVFIGSTLLSITFANDQVGYSTGLGSVYRTDDGGATWVKKSNIANLNNRDVMDAAFPDPANPMVGYVCVANEISTLFKTTDGGDSWNIVTLNNVTSSVNDLEFTNPLEGWAVGGESNVYRFSGNAWSFSNTPFSVNLNAVTTASGSEECWAVGNSGTIFHYTPSFGWLQEAPSLTGEYLAGVDATNASTVYAVGMNKTFLKYTLSSGINDIGESEILVVPNPAYDHISILSSDQKVKSAEVLDVFGNHLTGLCMESMDPYHPVFNIGLLKPGVYFIRISTGENPVVKRLVKI